MPESSDAGTDSPDTGNQSVTPDLDRDFILLHEATTTRNFEAMDDIESPEASLARARGRGRFPALEDSPETEVQGPDDDAYLLRIDRGKLSIDTGYVMRFVDADLRHCSVFDICSVPELPSYPVSETALDSLTRQQRGVLDQQGYLRIQAAYDSDIQSFQGVQKGWELPADDPLDRLMEVAETLDGRTAPAISYLVATEGPETVREQIQEAEAALEDLSQ